MEKMDLALTGPTRFQSAEPAPRKAGRLVWLIVGSVLVHIAVLATLSFPPPASPPVNSRPVQAVLYTPVVPAPTQPTAAELPDPVVTDVPPEEPEIGESQPENQLSQPEATTPPPPQAEEIPDTGTEASAPPSGEILTQAEDSPAPPSRRLSNAVSRGIAGLQSQKQHELAEQVTRQRRLEQKSPDLRIGEYQPAEQTIGEYAVNCEKGVNSTVATVARLFGGNVKCNSRNEFQQFIDKRQHKQPEQ
ncbi:hypothetical protein EXU34_05175 [Alteromonas sp. ZYF713]|nr:hypothetical protein [Alteromonas sp. ZYF713]